jgi:AraC-like DNA-binding protein/mannose-6-phosphate isomerase-like protein (cupin superfamily)
MANNNSVATVAPFLPEGAFPMDMEPFSCPLYEFTLNERKLMATPEHSHQMGQLLFVRDGLAVFTAEKSVYTLVHGLCAWTPPGVVHSMQALGAVGGCAFYVPQQMCLEFPRQTKTINVTPLLGQVVSRLTSENVICSPVSVQKRLLSVLGDELHRPQPEFIQLPAPKDRRLQTLVGLQTSIPELDHDLDSWARKIGMSKRSITRQFRKELGMTFGQWRQRMRILRAGEMIMTGSSVTDAAVAVGYDSVSAFSKTFRLIYGQLPSQFKELQGSLTST